jgi:hypothetical protein
MAEQRPERRKQERVKAGLNLQIRLPRGDGVEEASLETLNISSSGIYFRSDHFIEPMTKLQMGIELAVPSQSGESRTELKTVSCEGLVVRAHPQESDSPEGPYEIAVFFTNVDPDGLVALEEHIALLLAAV